MKLFHLDPQVMLENVAVVLFFFSTSWTGSMAASLAAISSLQPEGPKLWDSEFYMPELGSFETFFLFFES